MNKKILLCLSLICFTHQIPSPLHATQLTEEAHENMTVGSIEITPVNLPETSSFDSKTIIDRLKTQIGDPFSQTTFDEDLKSLAQEYDRIEPTMRVHKGEMYITIKVWPKPTIRSIAWTGNEYLSTRTLKKELGVTTHKPFNRQAFNKGLNKVKELYIKKGYFESQIQYTLKTDPKTNEVDIVIEVQEGRSGKIDSIIFNGFTKK